MGMAGHRQYCTASHCDGWLKQEAAARKARLGLCRAEKRSSAGSSAPVAGTVSAGPAESVVYHGDQKAKVFQGPSCQYYFCKYCVVKFRLIVEAKPGFKAPPGVLRSEVTYTQE